MAKGNIASNITVDTTSYTSLPSVPPSWVATPIGGPLKECEKIKINGVNAQICDTSAEALLQEPYPSVPGLPQPAPDCVRGPIIPTQNTSVYFEGQLVVVNGDAIQGSVGVPNPRVLTEPTLYPTILIGTQVV